jgi:hypothetical protein
MSVLLIILHHPRQLRITPAQQVSHQWRQVDNIINNLPFNLNKNLIGLNPDLIDTLTNGFPWDFYNCIINDNIISKIELEKNKFASQKLMSTNIAPYSYIKK